MTVFSAVTYGTAASVANLALIEAGMTSKFDAGLFLAGWAFVFFTQLVAHFLGKTTVVAGMIHRGCGRDFNPISNSLWIPLVIGGFQM